MVDTTPFKICIQRAETRQEWDAMQDDYIARSLEACRRIEQLETALQKLSGACECWAAVQERGLAVKLLKRDT